AGGHGVETDAQQRQSKIEPEHLHEERGAPEDLDVGDADDPYDADTRHLADAAGESQDRTDHRRIQRQLQGHAGTAQESGQKFQYQFHKDRGGARGMARPGKSGIQKPQRLSVSAASASSTST